MRHLLVGLAIAGASLGAVAAEANADTAPVRAVAAYGQTTSGQVNCSTGWHAIVTVMTYGDTTVRAVSILSGNSQLFILRATSSPIYPKVYQTVESRFQSILWQVNAPQIYGVFPGCAPGSG